MRKDIKLDVGIEDATLVALFECPHENAVCVKCLGLGKCEHDCAKCFEDVHGKRRETKS